MMTVVPPALPVGAEQALLALQAGIDALPTYPERVAMARGAFSTQNRQGNATFDAVRTTLGAACRGPHRCMYCEDSAAYQMDHVRPKAFYPDLVFSWMNYLYACGPCNNWKQHRFSVLSARTSTIVELVRRRGEPTIEPEVGSSVLIDPRREEPLDYLSLDLVSTFHFLPRYPKGTYEYRRAEYTIDVLKLNDRDYLPAARREAYGSYRARLKEYVGAKGSPAATLLMRAMMQCGQPTVWAEMKRNADVIAELSELFVAAPEARSWQ